MIDVMNTLKIHEVDGKETNVGDDIRLQVRSHWNSDRYVVVRIVNPKTGEPVVEYTVVSSELQIAASNATRSCRHG